MKKFRICPTCGQAIENKGPIYEIDKRNYCNNCFEDILLNWETQKIPYFIFDEKFTDPKKLTVKYFSVKNDFHLKHTISSLFLWGSYELFCTYPETSQDIDKTKLNSINHNILLLKHKDGFILPLGTLVNSDLRHFRIKPFYEKIKEKTFEDYKNIMEFLILNKIPYNKAYYGKLIKELKNKQKTFEKRL